MNKEWFNLSEITSFSGTHSTVQGNRKLANRKEWKKRKCSVGKGFEYHTSSLPQETQQFLAKQAAEALANAEMAPARSARKLAVELDR